MSIPKHVTALANHKGAAILHAGGMLIPIKIMDIEHEESIYAGAKTTFKGLVVDANSLSTTELMKSAKAASNSVYGAQAFRDTIKAGLPQLDTYVDYFLAKKAAAHMPCVVKETCYDIENVGFTATSTTVFWKDGTKTEIVYQDGDPDFKEHDLALAFSLKAQGIAKVIFNNPHTIVLWGDKTKTIVKCQEGDTYAPATGLAFCIAKKRLGNKSNFNDVFKKHISNY